jgi:hypothetical protein
VASETRKNKNPRKEVAQMLYFGHMRGRQNSTDCPNFSTIPGLADKTECAQFYADRFCIFKV